MKRNNIKELDTTPYITIRRADYVERPRFSFVVPTYKRTDLLQYALGSIFVQEGLSDESVEVVVTDNNAERNDETEQYIASISDKRISYYKNEENIGGVGNWNRACTVAQGEWVIMLHDDDMLYYDYFKYMRHTIQLYKDKAEAFFPCFNSGAYIGNKQPARMIRNLRARFIKEIDFLTDCVLACPLGMCIKKEKIIEAGGFNPEFIPSIDYDFYVKLVQCTPIVKLYYYPLGSWRIQQNDSMNKDVMLKCLDQLNDIQERIIQHTGKQWLRPILRHRNRVYNNQHILSWYREVKRTTPETTDLLDVTIVDKAAYWAVRYAAVLLRHIRSGAKNIQVK